MNLSGYHACAYLRAKQLNVPNIKELHVLHVVSQLVYQQQT
jgi:hypothetical protein